MNAPSVDLIIKGGQVVTATDVLGTAVAVKDGLIVPSGSDPVLNLGCLQL